MFRLHDWRALCATMNGTMLLKPALHRQLVQWRRGRAPAGLCVFATLPAPLLPLAGPAQVVWDGWTGPTPRRPPPLPARPLELVPLLLTNAEAEALRRQAFARGVSTEELVGAFIEQLERDLEQQEQEEREAG